MKRALRRGRTALAIALLALLVAGPALAAEGSAGSGGGMRAARATWDLLVLRPLGLVQTVVSLPFLVLAYPITLVTGGSDDVIEICWTQPVDQTFRRPLGDL